MSYDSLAVSTLTEEERVWRHEHTKPVPLECGYEFACPKTGQDNCDVLSITMCGQYTRNCSAVFFLWLQFCVLLVGLSAGSNGALEPRGVITQTMECSVG